ncbi:phage tail tube protein [Glaciimonas sp. PCH181]|uniref:phage tail tube protein n=1 Tax=Glaciimonas sp. PCH181 TaxID=2133943 RepID=UPI001CEC8730|nr:phage tail tube protein [Glaciimonas sp. PCH181]
MSIGTGTGGAKNITAIALGNPTILTITAHGFNNGDVETLAGLAGADAALLNGLNFTVKNKTTNTIAIDADTTGKTITAAGTATPVTFTPIGNLKDFSGFDGSASEIDRTNMSSVAKEFLLGITDPGQFSINIDYDGSNAGHIALRSKQGSGVISNFQLTLPNTSVITFTGFVKKFSLAGGVDALVKTAVDIRISGPVSGL